MRTQVLAGVMFLCVGVSWIYKGDTGLGGDTWLGVLCIAVGVLYLKREADRG